MCLFLSLNGQLPLISDLRLSDRHDVQSPDITTLPVITSTERRKGEERNVEAQGRCRPEMPAEPWRASRERQQASAPSIFINQLFQELSATP